MAIHKTLSKRWIHLVVVVCVIVSCLLAKPRMKLLVLGVVLECLLLDENWLVLVEFMLIRVMLIMMVIIVVVLVSGSVWGDGRCRQSNNWLKCALHLFLLQLMTLLRFVFRSESNVDSTIAVEFL